MIATMIRPRGAVRPHLARKVIRPTSTGPSLGVRLLKAAGRYRRRLYAFEDERTEATEEAVNEASQDLVSLLDELLLSGRSTPRSRPR